MLERGEGPYLAKGLLRRSGEPHILVTPLCVRILFSVLIPRVSGRGCGGTLSPRLHDIFVLKGTAFPIVPVRRRIKRRFLLGCVYRSTYPPVSWALRIHVRTNVVTLIATLWESSNIFLEGALGDGALYSTWKFMTSPRIWGSAISERKSNTEKGLGGKLRKGHAVGNACMQRNNAIVKDGASDVHKVFRIIGTARCQTTEDIHFVKLMNYYNDRQMENYIFPKCWTRPDCSTVGYLTLLTVYKVSGDKGDSITVDIQ